MEENNSGTKTVLLIEDDPDLAELISEYLGMNYYEVQHAPTATEGLETLFNPSKSIDLVILDLMLPDMDGMQVCQRIRQHKDSRLAQTAIIMLTAKGSDADRIAGLEAGADDYLPKPFNPKELLARIKAVLRRQNRELPGAPSQQVEVVEFGPWTLDLSTRTLKRDGNVVTLTTGEFSVLKALVQHPREPLTRDKLMNLARGREWGAMERSIDVQVSRLRRLIEDNPSQARYIQTVWGVGYVFVPDGAEG